MDSKRFWKLIATLGLAFAFPWLCLIVFPFVTMSTAEPTEYSDEDAVEGGVVSYPDPGSDVARLGSGAGARIYAAEGCAYCHTQMIRPTYAGVDRWRHGWSGREADGLARETRPEDYYGEGYALLGYQRIGPDLANVGYRIPSREEMHRHLSDPKSFNLDSGMPAYGHLYQKSQSGDGRYVPTGNAEALVTYLLSRKKDAKIPAADPRGQ